MQALLFYRNATLLNSVEHSSLKLLVKSEADYSFAAAANSVMLAAVEFAPACAHYPIAFGARPDGRMTPLAVLGLRDNENLFVDEHGAWLTDCYVPAFVRRYPFVSAETPDKSLQVCIDADFEGFSKTEGTPLFQTDGQPAETLRHALDLVQDYHGECVKTEAFCLRLQELKLLKEVSIGLQQPDGEAYTLGGLHVIDEARLMALKGPQLAELARDGHMAFIYAHIFSLGRLGRLPGLLAAAIRGIAQTAAPRVAADKASRDSKVAKGPDDSTDGQRATPAAMLN